MADTGSCCSNVMILPSFSKGTQAKPTAKTIIKMRREMRDEIANAISYINL